MRTIVTALAAVLVAMAIAHAEAASPDPENGRYTFKDVADGILRLDSRSGQVSLCSKRGAGWVCQAVPDERSALDSEIARLERENAALKQRLSGSEPRKPLDRDLALPSDAEIDRMMSVVERMWRRLVDMVQGMQKEQIEKRKDPDRKG